MARGKKLIWLQIILGVAFLLQPILLPVRPDDMYRFVFSKEILKNMLANVLILVFFYWNYYFLIPGFYLAKKYLPYFLIVILSFSTILFISNSVTSQISPAKQGNRAFPVIEFRNNHPQFGFRQIPTPQGSFLSKLRFFFTENDQIFFLFGSIVLFSLLLQMSNRYYKTENAKQEAEINYLLAQINPHFLFNTLNSIYTLAIIENATKASTGLLKLSGLMRYIITETHQNSVPLEKELECINDFIDLQKLRIGNHVKLDYDVSGKMSGKQIAPMLLIPFIENAFKYGISPDEDSAIQISIHVIDNVLTMKVSNNKVAINNASTENSGLGIENAKNRLNLLYPNKHDLSISETEKKFNVTLTITC
ncbi:MAG: histidine kinase [Saprospiraceae bacterium]|jgi:sensor histidine kinase YesM|nr:histidine kinase [Saprospiraceae bacterium]MCW5920547.1 histidine kinase [Bacteroidota bacterium]MCB0592368.1 histidine kinase [Saprospiraceae bacterium]MCO5282161.1 histidine kinase [Saprospiraceae bacterium]MCO6471836.1 histidine kinase [Saprospiraceae bacterium]